MATAVVHLAYYLVILSTLINGIKCSALKNLETLEPSLQFCQKIHAGYGIFKKDGIYRSYGVHTGYGVKSTYRPLIVQPESILRTVEDPTPQFMGENYTVYSKNGDHVCNFTFDNPHTEITINYQVSPTKLYFFTINPGIGPGPLFSVDMSTCTSKDVSKKFELKNTRWYYWIYHKDGFEAIFENDCNKTRVSYDNDGNQVGQPQPFLLNYGCLNAIPLSENDPRSSNFIARYGYKSNHFISLIDINGRVIKNLLTLSFRLPNLWQSDSNDYRYSIYSYCWVELGSFKCAQFDQFGNEVFRNSTKNVDSLTAKPVGVFNLKEGGVILVAFIEAKNNYHVVEMRPGRIIEKSYQDSDLSHRYSYVTNFNEADRQFTIRGTDAKSDNQMCWYNFFFPSKFE